MFRIGNGYDVHKLEKGLRLRVGGIDIDYEYGLVAHSDGDVLIHALCDALLGSLAMGDIGAHFPDTSAEFKDIDSRILLKRVYADIKERGYELMNADCTIIAQAPKFRPHIEAMQTELAKTMGVEKNQISVKATTTEKLGFTGRKEGIAALCTVLVKKN